MNQSLVLLLAVTVAGCTSTLEQINKDLGQVNQGLSGKGQNQTSSGKNGRLLQISPEQESKLNTAINTKTKNAQFDQAISEASPVIASFIKANACIGGYDGSVLNVYAAPGKLFPSSNYIGAPIPTLKYHDKSKCATVLRFQGWEMPAKNALRFEVVYISDSSGESTKSYHEVVKQASEQWLFTR